MTTTAIVTASTRRRWSSGPGAVLISLILPVVLAAAWWFGSAGSTSPFFPPLQVILTTFVQEWPQRFASDILPSLERLFLGYVIAVVVGVVLGAVLGRFRLVAYAVNPILQFFRALPATALVPISVIILGVGDAPKVLLIAFVSGFPILLNTIDGVRSIDPVLEDVSRSFRLTRLQRFFRVQLHAASPQVLAGMRVALSLAFVVMVTTELLAATNGIGYVTLLAQQSFQIALMWSGLILFGLLGLLINGLFILVERRLLRWYTHTREE